MFILKQFKKNGEYLYVVTTAERANDEEGFGELISIWECDSLIEAQEMIEQIKKQD